MRPVILRIISLYILIFFAGIVDIEAAKPETIEPFWRLSPAPPSNDVTVLSIDSNDVIYAAAWGNGIYKSTTDGASWLEVSNGLTNTNVTCIEITKNGRIFAGTYGGGIFYSPNGGMSWTDINGNLGSLKVKAIGIISDSTIIVGTHGMGVYKTTDMGSNWEQINSKVNHLDINCIIIAKDTSYVIGTNGGGTFRSTNGGEYWMPTSSGLKSLVVTDMIINEDGDIYTATNGGGIYVSYQNGSGWLHLYNRDNQPLEASCIALRTNEEPIVGTYDRGAVLLDLLYVGVPDESPWRNTERTYFGVSDIVVNSKGDVFTAQPFNGILKSTDGGYEYTDDSLGFNIAFMGQNINPFLIFNNNVILGTSVKGGIYRSVDKGQNWALEDLDGIRVRGFYRDNVGKLYAAADNGAYISEDDGDTWTKLNWDNKIFSIAANALGHIFIGDSAIRKSTDGGNTWSEKGFNSDGFEMNFIEVGPSGTVYCNMTRGESDPVGDMGLFKSEDNGESWNLLVNTEDFDVHEMHFRNGKIYCATGSGVQISSNNGTSWTQRDFGFASNLVENLGFTPSGSLVASDYTTKWLMISDDEGVTWDTLNFGKIEAGISEIGVNADGDIFVGTANIFRAIKNEDLESPSLNFPAGDAGGVELTPLLSWNSVDNTDLYEMHISKGPEFDEIVETSVTAHTKWEINTPLEFGQKYHWRVRSKRNSSVSQWSDVESFYTVIAAPELIYPEYNSFKHDTNITFRWEIVKEAATYRLQVANDIEFSDIVADKDEIDTNFAEVKGLKPDSVYYWRVRSNSFLSNSNWTDKWPFATKMSAPNLVLPVDSSRIYVTEVTLKWDTVPKATEYTVIIARDYEFNDVIYEGPAETDSTFKTEILEIGRSYFWKIKAMNELNDSYWSETWMFKITPEEMTLISPENGAQNIVSPVTFTWTAPQIAEGFIIQVSDDEEFANIIEEDSTLTDTTYTSGQLPFRKYYWRVKFKYGELFSEWSEEWSFTTSPGVVTLLSPDNLSKNIPVKVNLTWDAPKSAETFHLQVANDVSFGDPVIDEEGLTDKSYELNDLENYTSYYWKVRFKTGEIYSEWSEIWNFVTVLGTPVLVYPLFDSDDVETNPEFEWEASKGASRYHIQVSENDDFSNPVIDNDQVTKNTYPVEGLDTLTGFYWRVKALNSDGESDWSDGWKFSTNNIPTSVYDQLIISLDLQLTPIPFRERLNVSFNLEKRSFVRVSIMDESGRIASVIENSTLDKGRQELEWLPGENSSGTYYIFIEINGFTMMKKAVLIK